MILFMAVIQPLSGHYRHPPPTLLPCSPPQPLLPRFMIEGGGGGHLATEWIPIAKQMHGAELVNIKIQVR